ncbi:transcription factor ILR3-like [Olea europaea subsp. europaea]|uniref:Transcription factor ILR3-like n=1 Tax=Olea europaea subsp. europaea TaxID=158383 RepID=A0A8S0SES1_OLEEU|nr:transcription factor ILR3-like [Olea europaea subsp. europaea]
MESLLEENGKSSNWLFDYTLLDDIPVPCGDLPPLEPNTFHWTQPHNAFVPPTSLSAEFDDSFGNSDGVRELGSRKRMRSGTCGASDSKSHKEKIRRDKLNDRFQELSSILEPGRPPKMDKAVILSDAVRMVIHMREEAQNLKESYESLQEKVNELKAEKNELRGEKLKLKTEKEKLGLQVKALSTLPPGYLHHPHPIPAPFAASPPVVGHKLMPFVGYPGIPMWQFMPPTAVDSSEGDALPPVA